MVGQLIYITIQVSQTRHGGHCWGSKDELKRHSIEPPPPHTHGHASVARPTRNDISSVQTPDVVCVSHIFSPVPLQS